MYQQNQLLNAQVTLMEQQNQLLNAQNKLIKQQNTSLNSQIKLQALSLINVPKLNIKFHNKKLIIFIYYNGKLKSNVYPPTLYFFTTSSKYLKSQINAHPSLEQLIQKNYSDFFIDRLAEVAKKNILKSINERKNEENDRLFKSLKLKLKNLLQPSYSLLPEEEVIFETDKNLILKILRISDNKITHNKQCLKKLYVLVEVIFKSKFGWEYPVRKLVILDLIDNRMQQNIKEDEFLTFFTNKYNVNLLGAIKINSPITPTKKATNPFTLY